MRLVSIKELLHDHIVQPKEHHDEAFEKQFPFYAKLSKMTKEEYVAWVEKVQHLYLPKFENTVTLEYTLQQLSLEDGPAPQPQD